MSIDKRHIEELFEAAQKLSDPGQRKAFLDAACAPDIALRSRLEELLSAAPEAENFFNECSPALKLPPAGIAAEQEAAREGGTIRLTEIPEQMPGSHIGR